MFALLSHAKAARAAFALALLVCHAAAILSQAQTPAPTANARVLTAPPEVAEGIKLYQNGNAKGAIKLLRAAVKKQKADADAWHFLGLAYNLQNDLKEAAKAFEHAVELRPNYAPSRSALAYVHFLRGNLNDAEREAKRALELDAQSIAAHLVVGMVNLKQEFLQKALESAETILKIKPDYALAHFLKYQALSGLYWHANTLIADVARGSTPLKVDAVKEVRETQQTRLQEAAESLEAYLRLNPKDPEAEVWREQVESMRSYGRLLQSGVYTPNDVTQRAVIFAKPEPAFTEQARYYGTSGTVRLRMILGADGRIHNIIVVRGLEHGLTEAAIRAARRIRFTPALKNGVPVSQFVTVEYSFHVY